MSSFIGGIDSGFLSIAPYRLYLNLNTNDKEFNSGLTSVFNLVEKSQEMDDYTQVKVYTPNFENGTLSFIINNIEFKPFLDLIRYFRLENELISKNYDYTLFLPLDISDFKKLVKQRLFSPEDLMKYHIVDYPILPFQIIDRKNRIDTRLKNHFIFTDSYSIIGEDFSTNKTHNNILKSIKTDNGYIYIIEKSLTPYNLLI